MLVVGVLLLAASAATRFLAYPALDQLPSDFDRTAVYSGTGTFLNRPRCRAGTRRTRCCSTRTSRSTGTSR